MSQWHGAQIQTLGLMPSLGPISLSLHVLCDRDLSLYIPERGPHLGSFFLDFSIAMIFLCPSKLETYVNLKHNVTP